MEGAYNRVLSARQAVPHETYVYFMDLLAKTVRWVGFCYSWLFFFGDIAPGYLIVWFCLNGDAIVFFCSHRDEIAGCSEKGYDSLSVSDAKQMLMFNSDQDLHEYISEVLLVF